jgi:hypothetical protein
MANIALLISSLLMTAVHVCAIGQTASKIHVAHGWIRVNFFGLNPAYAALLLRGCISSIANHASTSNFIQHYDRMVMVESACVDALYILYIHSHAPSDSAMCLFPLALLLFAIVLH